MSEVKFEKCSVEYIDHMGDDTSVVNAARVSFNKKVSAISEKDNKLLRYLAKHEHWSPFAHTSLQLRVKAPIFLARQFVKHCVGGVWNEVSRRYVNDNITFFTPLTWREKPTNAKQGSDGPVSDITAADAAWTLYNISSISLRTYEQLISLGIAPEQARMVLPLNVMTEWYWTGSVMFWHRVYRLRIDNHAQEEAQAVARMIGDICQSRFPLSWAALTDS